MRYAINLFPSRQPKVVERLGYFALHYVRYALVIVLSIVLVVFFLRVRVDQDLVDQKEKLAMQRTIIQATQPLRADLEYAQRKVTLINSIFEKQGNLLDKLSYVNEVLPKAVRTQSIQVQEKGIIIEGKTSDYRIIQQFFARLTSSEKFDKVQLTRVQREASQQYTFTLSLEGYHTTGDASKNIEKSSN
ncbi:MAG TPA: PilN domain-containing protein [Candidatus Woesebacteria bacterium]|nr:PilN domain-containing protein [Candidatus Woesebacteria bacterium]